MEMLHSLHEVLVQVRGWICSFYEYHPAGEEMSGQLAGVCISRKFTLKCMGIKFSSHITKFVIALFMRFSVLTVVIKSG